MTKEIKCDGCQQMKPAEQITTEHGVSVCDICGRKNAGVHLNDTGNAAMKVAVDGYLATIERLEPDINPIDASAFYASAAISLKRIADAMTTNSWNAALEHAANCAAFNSLNAEDILNLRRK